MRSKRFFELYQYLAPVVLFPLSCWLWFLALGDYWRVAQVVSIPIIVSYVIPAIGTNKLCLWEFNTKFLVGKFRIQHGFVFGSATNFLSFIIIGWGDVPTLSFMTILRGGIYLGASLGLINWWYDIFAIKTGMIRVHNRAAAENRGPEAIATAYAPVYFTAVGFFTGLYLVVAQSRWLASSSVSTTLAVYLVALVATLTLPALLFVCYSLSTTGETGLKAVTTPTNGITNEAS